MLAVINAFAFGVILAILGHPLTTPEYWILIIMFSVQPILIERWSHNG